jgi:hypothetical protein
MELTRLARGVGMLFAGRAGGMRVLRRMEAMEGRKPRRTRAWCHRRARVEQE